MRKTGLFVVGACALAASVTVGTGQADAQSIKLPTGFAYVYSFDANGQAPADCGDGYVEGTLAATASRTCTFRGRLSGIDVGNFTTSGNASFVQGQALRARATLSGTLGTGVFVYNDAYTAYSDAMTITGAYAPSSVVFRLAIDGTFTNPSGNSGDPGIGELGLESGRVDLVGWNVSPDGTINNGTNLGGNGLIASGDGSTQTMDVTVPWDQFVFGNTIAYQLSLVAFARGRNYTDAPVSAYIDADYSNTARLQSYAVYDAAGNDITNLDNVVFASTVTATPEPAAFVLLATGLVGLVAVHRRTGR